MSQIQINLARKETLYTGKRLPHGCDVTYFPVILPRWSLQSTIKGCIGLINVQSIIATFAMHIISEITGVRNPPPRILRTANVNHRELFTGIPQELALGLSVGKGLLCKINLTTYKTMVLSMGTWSNIWRGH